MKYKFRRNADLGLWCTTLLPLCLFSLSYTYNEESYFILFVICTWLSIFDILKKQAVIQKFSNYFHHHIYIVTSIPVSFLIWKCFTFYKCFIHIFALCVAIMGGYNYLKNCLLKYCPGSFTLGEAMIVSQSIVLFLLSCEISVIRQVTFSWSGYIQYMNDIPNHIKCLQILYLVTLVFLYLVHTFSILQESIHLFSACIITAVFTLVAWHITFGQNFFSWLTTFCMQDAQRMKMILYWTFCTCMTLVDLAVVNISMAPKGSPLLRKMFHFIISVVFAPGILFDLELLRLASGLVLVIFIMLEVFRLLQFPIIGPGIENAFKIFLDEKDTGVLVLTHIYLLVGCSCPIWLRSYDLDVKRLHISLFSGVLSIGIGDSLAAIGGKVFGKHKWKGTNKTIEGSFCCLIIQGIFALCFLHLAGHEVSNYNMGVVMAAVVMTTYLEAKTVQVDNLVLPLFMFSILVWVI